MSANISSTSTGNSIAYINGRVYTINDSEPRAEAFIVSPTGTFFAIGSSDDIRSQAQQDGLIVHDLNGVFVMPGIHDAHLHLLMAGISKLSGVNLGLENVIPAAEAATKVKAAACMCSYAHAFGDWLVGDIYQFEDYDSSCLDGAYPDTPVLIRGTAAHSCYLNQAAMTRSGYDIANEPPVKAAVMVRRPDGSLTGEMSELGMTKAILATPKPPLAHVKRSLKHAIARLHQTGITSCQDASGNTILLTALRELEAENALKVNMYAHIVYAPEFIGEESTAGLHALIDRAHEYQSDHVDTRFIKMMLDGVPPAPHYTHAGLTSDGQIDESKIFLDNAFDAVRFCDSKGLTVKIHCTGHGATRRALDAFEAVRKTNPHGPRHEIAHCSGVHDDEYKRFKQLNVTAEMSPSVFFSHPLTEASGGLMDWNFNKMIDAGAHVTIGSDWGVPEDPSPFPALALIVEKVGNGNKVKGGEILCRMLTLSGAEAVGAEKKTGSIEVGKRADFIALDKDLSKGDFEGVKVLRTWFAGEVVWESP